jgi:hypothetical protein
MITLKNSLTTKLTLKACAFILGFSFWYILGQFRPIELSYAVPLIFYENKAHTLEAPETVTVCLKGYKNDFYNLDLKELAVHLNADLLHEGKNFVQITEEHLFLPREINLVHYKPSNVVVMVKNT